MFHVFLAEALSEVVKNEKTSPSKGRGLNVFR